MTRLQLRRESIETLAATSETLIACARDVCVDFLHCELRVAHTFLDLATSARDETARDRRLGRSAEAAAEVERYLSRAHPLGLPYEDCERLSRELQVVRRRLASSR